MKSAITTVIIENILWYLEEIILKGSLPTSLKKYRPV